MAPPLRIRLVLLVSLILFATFIFYGVIAGKDQSETLVKTMQEHRTVTTGILADACAQHLVLEDYAGIEEALLRAFSIPSVKRLQVALPDGVVVEDLLRSGDGVPRAVYDSAPLEPGAGGSGTRMTSDAMVIWQPILAGKVVGWLKATYGMEELADLRARTWRESLLLAGLWMLAAVGLILLAMRGPVNAIRKTSEFAKGLTHPQGQQLLLAPASLEIDQLAESLNFASRSLYDSGQQLLLERQRFEALFTLSQMADRTEKEITQFALEEGVRLTRSRVGYLHFLAEEGPGFSLWSRGAAKECKAADAAHFPLDRAGMWADPVRLKKPVIHNDYPNLPGKRACPEGHIPLLRHLGVPVLDGEKIVAVAGVGNKDTDYSDEDARRLGLFMSDMWKLLKNKRADAFIKNVLGAIGEGLVVVDRNYRIVSANRIYCEAHGVSEQGIAGKRCYEVSHRVDAPCHETKGGCACPVEHSFRTGEACTVVHEHPGKDGKMRFMECKAYPLRDESGSVVSAIEIVDDVTHRMHLEEELRQAQKMEAVGQLTGGIAHDFNNILTAIIGFSGMLKKRELVVPEGAHFLDQVLGAADRAAGLTRSLLAFSRRQVMELKPVDLNGIVGGLQNILTRLIGEDVEFGVRLAREALTVTADRGQLEQVLMNLAANARDAMPKGGRLDVETGAFLIDEASVAGGVFDKPGWHAVLSVTDTGIGMDEAVRMRIFEPFFTTKEFGKGTGLGLAIIYGIVKQHGGQIHVYSEPGKGSTFKIYLPLSDKAALERERALVEQVRGGSELLLIAEDDAAVRNLLRAILETAGYRVLEAVDGESAVRVFEERRQEIALTLIDAIMPKMNGKEAFDAMRKAAPGCRALFMSGYAGDIIGKTGILQQDMQFIQKPISPDNLLRKVRTILDGQAAA